MASPATGSDLFDGGTTAGNIEIGAVQGVGFALAYVLIWFLATKFLGVRHP